MDDNRLGFAEFVHKRIARPEGAQQPPTLAVGVGRAHDGGGEAAVGVRFEQHSFAGDFVLAVRAWTGPDTTQTVEQ